MKAGKWLYEVKQGWSEKKTNEKMRQLAGVGGMEIMLKAIRLRWYSHVQKR